jgi:cytochrome b subunit of formate dehydrogenase
MERVKAGPGVVLILQVRMFPEADMFCARSTSLRVCNANCAVAVLFVAAMLARIYIGTIGMEGAFEAMWDGTVDVNWAREHHKLWIEEEIGKDAAASTPRHAAAHPAE